jgi:hypothetical protein
VTFSTASSPNRAGLCPLRSDGRLHKIRLEIAAATVWSVVSAANVPDNNIAPSGEQ